MHRKQELREGGWWEVSWGKPAGGRKGGSQTGGQPSDHGAGCIPEGLGGKSLKWGIPDPTAGQPRATANIRGTPIGENVGFQLPPSMSDGKIWVLVSSPLPLMAGTACGAVWPAVNDALSHRVTAGHLSEATVYPRARSGGS